MKTLKIAVIALILSFGISSAKVYADDTAVSGSASVDVMSNYVWRGFKLSNSYVIQPSVGITYGDFGVNLWSNYDGDFNNQGELTETDLTLNYTFSIDKISLDAGYIYYGLEGIEDTQEIYLSAGFDTMLNPAITVYYDIEEGNGAFITASIGHDLELANDITLSLGASASYNMDSDYSIGDYNDFHNGDLAAAIGIPLGTNVSVSPMIAYSFPLSDDAEDAMKAVSDDGDKYILYGGVNLSLSF
ncbi:MAG: hypothetical protein VST72_07645 [Nitrospirota bacterium]|nr:hypothetical protein [Nitrospirota bacterium]